MAQPRRGRSVSMFTVVLLVGSLVGMAGAVADGTEELGSPSITLADGTGVAVGGVGLFSQPGVFEIEVPDTAEVDQVLVYWETSVDDPALVDQTLELNGVEIEGQIIGGPTEYYPGRWTSTQRADVTDLDLVTPGVTLLSAAGLDAGQRNDGVVVAAIYSEPGSSRTLTWADGNDFAFRWAPDGPLTTTAPVTLTLEASAVDRTVEVVLFAGSVMVQSDPLGSRPHDLIVEVGDQRTTIIDPFTSNLGDEIDALTLEVAVPAGVADVTLSVESVVRGDGNPASLVWFAAGVVADLPVSPTTTTTSVPVSSTLTSSSTTAPTSTTIPVSTTVPVPTTTTTTTTAPATTTTTLAAQVLGVSRQQAPPVAVVARSSARLPDTGSTTRPLVLLGLSGVLLGAAAVNESSFRRSS